jgi:MarR family transcriptional regulator, 2-MHQ and catechol-resistance regulon repressor
MTGRARPTKADVGRGDARLTDPRITAIGLIIEAVGGLNAKLASQYAEHGLAPAEFEVLVRIARTRGQALRMSDLAAQTLLTTSGITRVVDRLERDGLVDRRPCPTDRRGALAAITPAGLKRLDAVLPGHLALVDKWFTSLLSPQELEALLDSLRIVRDAVRPEATAGADAL